MQVQAAGEQLDLLPDRAVHWARERTLFIADTHFGKTATFRKSGIAAPEGVTLRDTQRLAALIAATGAERLVILGDFFHAPAGRIAETEGHIAAWRADHNQLEILLIRGNHDRGTGDPPLAWNFRVEEPGVCLGPFLLSHKPDELSDRAELNDASPGYILCGHLHPAVVLSEPGGAMSTRLPCFLFGEQLAILPAFGRFTGARAIKPRSGQRVFVLADDEVVAVA